MRNRALEACAIDAYVNRPGNKRFRSRLNFKAVGDAVFVHLARERDSKRTFQTLIDREDFERVTKFYWRRSNGYAVAVGKDRVPKHHRALASFILDVKPGQRVDHINGDTLDNRKCNLRIATPGQNAKNMLRPTSPGKSSQFKGVTWDRSSRRWAAKIKSDGEVHDLGRFALEEDAARAYDEAAKRLHGEFAKTNEMMRLYGKGILFVPDCSRGPRRCRYTKPVKRLCPPKDYAGNPLNYDPETLRLKEEIAAFEQSGELPTRYGKRGKRVPSTPLAKSPEAATGHGLRRGMDVKVGNCGPFTNRTLKVIDIDGDFIVSTVMMNRKPTPVRIPIASVRAC